MVLSLIACKQESGVQSTAVDTATTVQSTAVSEVLSTGTFTGRSDHVMSGGASIVKTDSGYDLVLADDFFLDGAPAPVVVLVNDEKYNPDNKIGDLQKITGSQAYSLPADFAPGQFNQVMVWCEQASAPLGIAELLSN